MIDFAFLACSCWPSCDRVFGCDFCFYFYFSSTFSNFYVYSCVRGCDSDFDSASYCSIVTDWASFSSVYVDAFDAAWLFLLHRFVSLHLLVDHLAEFRRPAAAANQRNQEPTGLLYAISLLVEVAPIADCVFDHLDQSKQPQ